jgi:photosystem II stability/assembly factor-like uncharacterized protein
MASTQTPLERTDGQPQKTPRKRRRTPFLLILLAIILVLVGWQVTSTRNHSATDPTVAGQPLSNPEMHLHTVALGSRPGVLYLGTHFGLFTSTDGGRTWPQARGSLNTLMVTVIAVSPKNAQELAIIGVPSVSGGAQQGVYFSSDGGNHWDLRSPTGLPGSAYPFTVRAGVDNGHFYAFYLYAGWFETSDMGLHWRLLSHNPLSNMQNQALLTFPDQPDHLLLGGAQGLFESRDDGAHWNQITTVQGGVQTLVASHDASTIFCATDQALYRWQEGAKGAAQITRLPYPGATPFSRIVTDVSGEVLYALSGRDLWYSSDGGANWQQRWRFDREDLVALVIDPQHPQQLYAGFFLPPAVLSSTDSGKSWQMLTGRQ